MELKYWAVLNNVENSIDNPFAIIRKTHTETNILNEYRTSSRLWLEDNDFVYRNLMVIGGSEDVERITEEQAMKVLKKWDE